MTGPTATAPAWCAPEFRDGDRYDDECYYQSTPRDIPTSDGTLDVALSLVTGPDRTGGTTVDLCIGRGAVVSLTPAQVVDLIEVLRAHATAAKSGGAL